MNKAFLALVLSYLGASVEAFKFAATASSAAGSSAEGEVEDGSDGNPNDVSSYGISSAFGSGRSD